MYLYLFIYLFTDLSIHIYIYVCVHPVLPILVVLGYWPFILGAVGGSKQQRVPKAVSMNWGSFLWVPF